MIEPMDIVVNAGFHPRAACPVWVQLPLIEGGGIPNVRLTDETGRTVPCQLEPSGTGTEDRIWLTWIVSDLAKGHERRYRLEPAGDGEDSSDHGPGVVLAAAYVLAGMRRRLELWRGCDGSGSEVRFLRRVRPICRSRWSMPMQTGCDHCVCAATRAAPSPSRSEARAALR